MLPLTPTLQNWPKVSQKRGKEKKGDSNGSKKSPVPIAGSVRRLKYNESIYMKINRELNQLSDKHRKKIRWPNVQHTDGQMYNVKMANVETSRWRTLQCKDGQLYKVMFVK